MLSHSLAIGYHGCDRNLAGRIVAGETELKPSENAWDWLGHGIYFWEDWITFKSAFVRPNRSSVISCRAEMFDGSTGAGSERTGPRFCQPHDVL
jgi:hypothetical protein